jgi:hypothetical protein
MKIVREYRIPFNDFSIEMGKSATVKKCFTVIKEDDSGGKDYSAIMFVLEEQDEVPVRQDFIYLPPEKTIEEDLEYVDAFPINGGIMLFRRRS